MGVSGGTRTERAMSRGRRGRVAAVLAGFVMVTGAVVLVGGAAGAQSAADAPTGLTAVAGDEAGELAVSWDPHAIATRDYRLAWAPLGEDFKQYRDLTGNAYPTDASYTISGLTPGGQYKVRVKARFTGQAVRASAWTDTVTATTAEPVTTEPEGVESEIVLVPTTEPEPLISLQSQHETVNGPVRGNRRTRAQITTDHNWAAGTALSGELDSSRDQDWYRIWLDDGVCYSFDVRGRADWEDYQSGGDYADVQQFAPQTQLTLDYPLLEGVYDFEGRYIYDSQGTDDTFNQATRIRPIRSDFYFVAVAKGSWSGSGGSYDLSAFDYGSTRHCNELDATRPRRSFSEPAGKDLPDFLDENFDITDYSYTRGYINVGDTVTGVVESENDFDWYAFDLAGGEFSNIYRFRVTGVDFGSGELVNPGFALRDSARNKLVEIIAPLNASGGDAVLEWIVDPGEAGRYYTNVFYAFIHSGFGGYEMSVSLLTPRLDASVSEPDGTDFPDEGGTDTPGYIVVGDSVTGYIGATDFGDWFRVGLIAGTAYRIVMGGSDSGSGTLDDLTASLYDFGGDLHEQEFNDGDSSDVVIMFEPAVTGWYYVEAYSDEIGTYTITVTEQS